jgi:putative hydrolase of the HAD superfamily
VIRAALFDIGGVILSSPFEAFAHYEADHGLPANFIRTLNATNPDANAWARLERSELGYDEFCDEFEREALAAGHHLDARAVMGLLSGEVRPAMVEAVRRCRTRLKTAALTNNFVADVDRGRSDRAERGPASNAWSGAAGPHGGHWSNIADGGPLTELMDLFDVVIESSRAGVRKPDPRFYELACAELAIKPEEAVFLDDLGVNLKPARAMGMITIKVVDPDQAIADLEAVVGFPLGDAGYLKPGG